MISRMDIWSITRSVYIDMRNKGNSEAAVSEVGTKSRKILGSQGKKMLPETG